MRQFLFLIFCLIIGPIAFTQNRTLDSLYQTLENHTEPDTVRLKIIFEICYRENTLHPEKSKLLAEEALGIAKKLTLNFVRDPRTQAVRSRRAGFRADLCPKIGATFC